MIGKGKHILIVAYIFPPTSGIGGRRWAKFAKYFAKLGYTVHVICSVQHNREISLWIDDVKDNPNIITYGIRQKYPAVLSTIPKTIFEKIQYKIALNYVSIFSKGSIYDSSIFWNKEFEDLAKIILEKNNIEIAVVTIAPIHHATRLIKLKNQFHNTKFVADFRDPWILGNRYGFPQTTINRHNYENEAEKNVCEKYDLITMPNDDMINASSDYFSLSKEKYYKLEHAIDIDDFENKKKIFTNHIVSLLYIGTLYPNLKDQFDAIFKATISLENVKFEFLTSNNNESYFAFAKKSQVLFNQQIEPKLLFEKISNSNFVLVVLNNSMKVTLYTKFIEIVCARTPIILISNHGEATEFVVKNKLGFHLNYDEVESKLPLILKEGKMKDYNYNFDFSDFTFENITNKLIDRITNLE